MLKTMCEDLPISARYDTDNVLSTTHGLEGSIRLDYRIKKGNIEDSLHHAYE